MTDPHGAPDALKRVARGGSANFAATVVSAVLGLGLTIVVARGFDTASAGEFFAATSVFLILVAVAVFGTDSSLPRFIPALRVRGREDQIRPVVRLSTQITLIISGLLLVMVVTPFGSRALSVMGQGGDGGADPAVLWMVVACVPFAAVANNYLAATRGYLNIRPTVWVDRIGRPSLQLAAAAIAAAASVTIDWAIGSWLFIMALAVIPAGGWLSRIHSDRLGPAVPIAGDVRGEYLRYSWPRAVARLMAVVLQRLDVVVVAAMLSPSDAAIYAVATRVIVLAQLAGNSLQQVIAPRIAHSMEIARPDEAMRLSRISAGWVMLAAWPVCLLAITTGEVLLRILGGDAYGGGASAMAILGLALLVGTMVGPVDTVVLMSGSSLVSLFNMSVAVVVDVVLMLWWIPLFGINGAAAAWASAILVRSLLGVVVVRRLTGQAVLGKPAAAAAVASGLAFAALPSVLQLGSRSTPAALAGMALCCAVYIPLLWFFRRPLALDAFSGLVRSRRRRAQVDVGRTEERGDR